MTFLRGIEPHARKILWDYRKMAFVSSPRRVGKTTFAKRLLENFGGGTYFNFLITGSARLDLYSKGGDSPMGRYLGITLFPLAVAELTSSQGTFEDFTHALREPPKGGKPSAPRIHARRSRCRF
jgi:predicted AAA+ superfamily ATPase